MLEPHDKLLHVLVNEPSLAGIYLPVLLGQDIAGVYAEMADRELDSKLYELDI